MIVRGAVSSDDSLADLFDGQFLFFQLIGHQRLTNADAAALAVFSDKTAVKTLMAQAHVAMAVAGKLSERLGDLPGSFICESLIPPKHFGGKCWCQGVDRRRCRVVRRHTLSFR